MTSKQQVSVDEVSLNVIGVSIKAVQIGKKQMTLSVFRQLQNESIWDYGDPLGPVWGHVNYFWNGCGCERFFRPPRVEQYSVADGRVCERLHHRLSPRDAVHIIWQNGSELRRSCVSLRNGEAETRYPFFCANDDPDFERSWKTFYLEHIEMAEQLFIAV